MADRAAGDLPGPIRGRQRLVLILAITAALISTAGLVASVFVTSPEEQRARAQPPPASLLTAVVERRVMESTLVTRGLVVAATTLDITPVVANVDAQVVTGVYVRAGAEIRPGQVLVSVSGRPLIVLAGKLPAYRDLKPGDSGPDIAQLQTALAQLGHYSRRDRVGFFGSGTKSAIRSLFAKIGYDVPDTGGPGGLGDRPALDAARDAVDTAQQTVAAVERRIAAGEQAGPTEEPLSEQLKRARSKLQLAERSLADLLARTGPMLPLAEFVFVPAFPARVTALVAKVGDTVTAPLITVGSGSLAVAVRLRPDQATLVRAGVPARLTSEILGAEVAARIAAIGELTVDTAGSTSYHPATVQPEQELPAQWAGQDVRVTIVSARTAAEVLVVPLSAISASADGRTTVSMLGSAGEITRVEVRVGISGAGFVEVSPVTGGLAEGDRVVVGVAP